MNTLEEVWAYREEELYPLLFGSSHRGIFPLDMHLFTDIFGQSKVDPRWLYLGVIEFAPKEDRKSWLYVTSGGSTPWDTDPADFNQKEYSWLGVEFVLETPTQAEWPIKALQRLLAYQVLLCHGRFGEFPPLTYGHRIPAGGSIDGSDSELRFFVLAKPTHYPAIGQLSSGKFEFIQTVGITEGERDFAKATSTDALVSAMAAQGAFPVTNPTRIQITL